MEIEGREINSKSSAREVEMLYDFLSPKVARLVMQLQYLQQLRLQQAARRNRRRIKHEKQFN